MNKSQSIQQATYRLSNSFDHTATPIEPISYSWSQVMTDSNQISQRHIA